MKAVREADEKPVSCTCVIRNAPLVATTSMWDCKEHGEPDELGPLPGQALHYGVLIAVGSDYQIVGPLSGQMEVDEARFLAKQLKYAPAGTLAISSLGDLRALAAKVLGPKTTPDDIPKSELPNSLLQKQDHDPDCVYQVQGHPGKCYVRKRPSLREDNEGLDFPEIRG